MESLIERMESRGLRMTWQRKLLAELLENAEEHLDAERIFLRAQKLDPRIHRATVYRTLNTLKQHGLIDELDLMHYRGDRHFYEIRPRSLHIHLVCMSCRTVAEPDDPFWDELKQKVQRETNFKPEVVRIEMGGTCAKCQAKQATAGKES